ncbi:KRI1-like family C-terminal-domain-containing protein [Pyronema domesticum]|uniref:Similar to Protein kri1 acc. no. Q09799 n=1 Tax=Pyronema omphalodes (strain CBS 100304) TaxID=1076935 RepID=U4L2Q2_PYROM|nr:KRI1-like family C-terminal-domain-containing protein [Pyronema domesticum]CCX09645.1 Similar to Protein kri1; acc. no. Q09799 [Pyronema omphalodes CBS 100304]
MPRPKKNKVPVPDTPSAQLLGKRYRPNPDTPSAQLFAEKPKTPKVGKTNLLDDSDDDEEDTPDTPSAGGFTINTEFARRFEHNKKREEMQRLEEKLKNNYDDDSEDDESSSEDEDDVAVLATEEVDQQISGLLQAIKNKDPRLYDGKTSFFAPVDETAAGATKEEKPMYLRDYHRENLLAGNTGDNEEEEEEAPQTFVQQQQQLQAAVIREMHQAAKEDEGDEDDGFLVKKPKQEKEKKEKKAKESDLPDPSTADQNPEEFLNKFLASRVWTKTNKAYVPLESDDSEEEDMADQFEANYNMRFEDPNAEARAKLVSYGRDAINENTVRREEKSRRKRAREEKRRKKEEEKAQREIEKGRLKKLKTEELMEKLKLVKEAAELSEEDDEAEAAMLQKLLEGDFGDDEWNAWMQERFGDKYYEGDKKPKKPVFDDDIDIGDIIPDFEDDAVDEDEGEEEADAEVKDEAADEDEDEEMGEADADEEEQPNKKTKKQLLQEKQAKKAKERSTRRKVERFVEDNFDFDAELPGGNASGFRYRETTPEAYGLGTLDILAADDNDLNAYAGLKKYATFRDEDKKQKDKKRYSKKKILRQWRKETFGNADGVQLPENWKPEGLVSKKAGGAEAGKVDIKERGDGERKKKRRKKN